jgi:hypothetical protein
MIVDRALISRTPLGAKIRITGEFRAWVQKPTDSGNPVMHACMLIARLPCRCEMPAGARGIGPSSCLQPLGAGHQAPVTRGHPRLRRLLQPGLLQPGNLGPVVAAVVGVECEGFIESNFSLTVEVDARPLSIKGILATPNMTAGPSGELLTPSGFRNMLQASRSVRGYSRWSTR